MEAKRHHYFVDKNPDHSFRPDTTAYVVMYRNKYGRTVPVAKFRTKKGAENTAKRFNAYRGKE